MPTFGRYNTTARPISSTALGAVWFAAAPGSERRYVVKTYEPDPNVLSGEDIRAGVHSFLERFRAQKRVAESGSAHWAAVHEVGEMPGGAYLVTDAHPWAARRLIDGGVRPTPAVLYAITTGVARGLKDLTNACHRGHGNLKAVNVLFDHPPGPRPPRVLLTDPAAERMGVSGEGAEANDLFALGGLLYELVMGRAPKRMMAWPIPDSPEWAALGRRGQGWRDLCNSLLHPMPAESLSRLDDLERQLPALAVSLRHRRPGLPVVRRAAVIGAAAAVVLVPTVWFLHRRSGGPPVTSNPTQPPVNTGGPTSHPATSPTDTSPSSTRPVAGGTDPRTPGTPDGAERRRRFDAWAAGIRPPPGEPKALRESWEAARRRSLQGLADPEQGVAKELDDLRDSFAALVRELSAQVIPAGLEPGMEKEEREKIYAEAAAAVTAPGYSPDPHGVEWQRWGQDYASRLGERARAQQVSGLLAKAAGQVKENKYREALGTVEQVAGLDQENAQAVAIRRQISEAEAAMLSEAGGLENEGDLRGAREKLVELIRRDPQVEEAIRRRDAIDERLRLAVARVETAGGQVEQGNYQAALGTLRDALKADPANGDAIALGQKIVAAEARMLADAGELEARRDYAGAKVVLDELLKRDPDFAPGTKLLRNVVAELGGSLLEQAKAKADGSNPDDWQAALDLLGRFESISGRTPESTRLASVIESRKQTRRRANDLLAEGEKLEKAGDFGRSLEDFNKAFGLEKDNPAARDRLADALLARALRQYDALDYAGAKGSLAALGPLGPNPPAARELLRKVDEKVREEERNYQSRLADLSDAATRLLNEGNPDQALVVLGRADGGRMKADVKKLEDLVRTRKATAADELKRGDDAYYGRNGSPVNHAAAFEAYQRSAQGGNAQAMLNLGGMYLNETAPKSPAQASAWFRRSAERANTSAMYFLAESLSSTGRPADRAEANDWYVRAANGGHVLALRKLGALFKAGGVVLSAELQAALWYRLASLYETGNGVPKDLEAARYWYSLAARNRSDLAVTWLDTHPLPQRVVPDPPTPPRQPVPHDRVKPRGMDPDDHSQ